MKQKNSSCGPQGNIFGKIKNDFGEYNFFINWGRANYPNLIQT